jgi:hypothetical protein
MTYKPDNHPLRDDFMKFFQEHNTTHFITLSFNREIADLYGAGATIRKFHRFLDRLLLGNRFNKWPSYERTLMFGIPERGGLRGRKHVSSTPAASRNCVQELHYHLMVKVPTNPRRGFDYATLQRAVHDIWKKLVPPGSVDVQEIYSAAGVADYVTKYIHDCSLFQEHLMVLPPVRPA